MQIVETHLPINIPGIEGLFIPGKTRGHILKVIGGDTALVRWEVIGQFINGFKLTFGILLC